MSTSAFSAGRTVIRAWLYDGRTSGARDAVLTVEGAGHLAQLGVQTSGAALSLPFTGLVIGERVGETHRLLQLADGASIEVLDNAAFDAALAAAGVSTREAPIRRLESRWRYAALAVLATLIGSVLFVRYGIPALAVRAVRLIPPQVDTLIGADSLQVLDRGVLHRSKLAPDRQAQLRAVFAEVAAGSSADSGHYRLEMRAGGELHANAFALPSGIVVLTDELEALAQHDDELRGVFAHEVGHLVNRHAMRMLVQNSATALLAAGIFGDASGITSLAATAPSVLINAGYSRDFEREADAFAFRWMTARHIDPGHLADLLERLEHAQGANGSEPGFLASHPHIRERVQAFRLKSEAAGQH
jgi:Zn-dependent protease with chaperone function